MSGIDWRELYAANRATIARSGVPMSGAAEPPPSIALANDLPHAPGPPPSMPLASRLPIAGLPSRRLPGGQASDRQALVHVPAGLDRRVPTAIVCMLHGCTQDPATFAAATAMNDAADRHGFVVVYPGQERARNPQGCWNWFAPEHQRRGTGEPEAIATILRDLIEREERCTIDPARVFVAGLSSGAAMAMILAVCYPDLIAAVAVHSGLAYASATDPGSAYREMAREQPNGDARGHAAHSAMGKYARPIPSLIIHGSADRTVTPANAVQVLRQSMHANHLVAPDTCNHDISRPTTSRRNHVQGQRPYTGSRWIDSRGALMHQLIQIDGLGHAWSGGTPGGSYTDPRGPSATEAIWDFFSAVIPITGMDTPLRA